MKKFTILASLLLASICGFAQEEAAQKNTTSIKDGWAVQIQLTPTVTAGDLSKKVGFMGGVGGQKTINSIVDWRFQLSGGTLAGKKKDIYFKGNLIELNTNFKVNYLTLFNAEKFEGKALQSYFSVGIALDAIKSERFNGNDVSLASYDRTNVLSIPLSLGMNYSLSDALSIFVEAGMSLLKTDMMDAWESNSKDKRMDSFTNTASWMVLGIKDKEGSQWQDIYGGLSIGVTYKF